RWGAGEAFLRSFVWRAPTAFPADTLRCLQGFIWEGEGGDDVFDVLLTLATIPDHPLNANFLDAELRRVPMPERDAKWSVFLHQAWQVGRAVQRLVDWAWHVQPDAALDNDTTDQCAIALAWMLCTSNRYLRDRATKALVSLLTGRLRAVVRLI